MVLGSGGTDLETRRLPAPFTSGLLLDSRLPVWENGRIMRIIIAGPPKTGNVWIKCLLAETYGLRILDNPPRTDEEFQEAIEAGWFPDDSIFHQHFAPTPLFLDLTADLSCTLVTIIRNPYDTFVSLYHFVQNFPGMFAQLDNPLNRIRGKPIDDPDVVEFLRDKTGGFRIHILSAKKWLDSERSIILRYEDLSDEPVRVMTEVTRRIRSVSEEIIRDAIESCSVPNMRGAFLQNRKHIRKGTVGDWQNHLSGEHLDAVKSHAGLIKALGYQVLEPEAATRAVPDEASINENGG